MPVTVTLLGQGTITVLTRSQAVTPDSRHFIASELLATEHRAAGDWYHHWPEEDCGNRLHAKALITLCQHHLLYGESAGLRFTVSGRTRRHPFTAKFAVPLPGIFRSLGDLQWPF
jgi:hypothetical protein